MKADTFKKAGIHFLHCRFAAVPEIPYVQDVLYALRLTDTQEYYDFCVSNHATYVINVGLVIAAVAGEVLTMERYDEAEARKMIARAILELTAERDKCLFNSAVIKAAQEAGTPLTDSTDWAILTSTCRCPQCRERASEMGFADSSA
jgi:hypothetical protein